MEETNRRTLRESIYSLRSDNTEVNEAKSDGNQTTMKEEHMAKKHKKEKKRIFKKDDNWTLLKSRQPGSLEHQGDNHGTSHLSMESTNQAETLLTHYMQEESKSRPRGNERSRTTREGIYDDHSKCTYYLRNRFKF